ncbi:MAG: glycosyltransferase family 9 protein [Candidatus Eisenbacteria bacterium]|nr:glycosyltransferase family 9 protein [Candidatus Eisenbacteria bacterium]
MRLSSLGDIVLTEPVVAALHGADPRREIGFAVKAEFRDLVAGDPRVSAVHALRGSAIGDLAALCGDVRRRRYSAVIDLHANARSAVIARSSGAPLVSVYRKREPAEWWRVRVARRPFRASARTVDRYLAALRRLGIAAVPARPRLHMPPGQEEWADGFLAGRGLRARDFVAMAPGAVWATKRWPAERYGEVVRELFLSTGLPTALVGSASERGACDAVIEAAGASSKATNAAGEATLGGTVAAISQAALFVGNDSGLTHAAVALGVPTVALFGPTDPGQFDFEGHAVVYADLACSACSFFGGERCPLGHWDCMRLITPDAVLASARGVLARAGGPR